MKKALLLIVLVIVNLMIAFSILSLKSDWAVAAFVVYIISLIFITNKIIKKL